MGKWSEAIEDGVVCEKCRALLIGEGELPLGIPTLCENCQQEEQGPLGQRRGALETHTTLLKQSRTCRTHAQEGGPASDCKTACKAQLHLL
jgi:hypothetical protein